MPETDLPRHPLALGSRWQCCDSQHRGQRVEVTRLTERTVQILVRHCGRVHYRTVPRAKFVLAFVPL